MMNQESIALFIVGLASFFLGGKLFQNYFASPLSQWLLQQGQVKFAMWIRKQGSERSGCSGCRCR